MTPEADERLAVRYGPWAVIAGASEGIGEALAQRLAAGGIDLALIARNESRLRAAAVQRAAAEPFAVMPGPPYPCLEHPEAAKLALSHRDARQVTTPEVRARAAETA